MSSIYIIDRYYFFTVMVLYDETQPKKGRGGGMLLGWDEFQFVILRLNFMNERGS